MIARQHLLTASGQGQIPFAVQEVGSWWVRNTQVDVVGVNRSTRQVIFGEARWRETAVTHKEVEALVEKSLLWLHGDTARWDVHYAFFAKAITESVEADESIYYFSPEDVTSFQQWKSRIVPTSAVFLHLGGDDSVQFLKIGVLDRGGMGAMGGKCNRGQQADSHEREAPA